MKSLWRKMIEAHDRTWLNRRIALERRVLACRKLWEASIKEHLCEANRREEKTQW